MSSIRYLAALDVIALNAYIMQEMKQASQVLDENILESALMRPQAASHYEQADLVTQAALLIEGIARAHAFMDGNKRTALAAGTIFLKINGYFIDSAPGEFGRQIEALVTRATTITAFVAWLRKRLRPLPA